jgi:aspartyl-tRNA(Asn)/glutamyl-tRNA(Gln) amidotransferase subunit B
MERKLRELKPTIGLEIHCELRTKSKLFCGCPADHFGKSPNTQTCPVCLGLPGALPVANRKAVEWVLMLGMALGSKINKKSKFDRKQYFYPDLPMGYQISQYDEPFCWGGFIDTSQGRVNIRRIHLEIDTGKLLHTTLDGKKVSLVDFNRSGVPLVEVVTEPEIKSGLQAKEFAKKFQQIVRYLEISDCDMEKGSMRLEANVSWGINLGYKVEIKNLNSFRFLEKAINYELDRQKKILEKNGTVKQETRGWSEKNQKTYSQRLKEEAEDYRYFPDPDLPPMEFDDRMLKRLEKLLPELPDRKKSRFVKEFALPDHYAEVLTYDKNKSDLYERAFRIGLEKKIDPKVIANLIINKGLSGDTPDDIVFEALSRTRQNDADLSLSDIQNAIRQVIQEQPKAVSDYKKGKEQVLGFLIGAVRKKISGGGSPDKIADELKKFLS